VTAKQVAHLCVSKAENLTSEQQKFLNQLTQANPVIDQCYQLINQFCRMVKERQGNELEGWLKRFCHLPIRGKSGVGIPC
jgi:hypothetical protein